MAANPDICARKHHGAPTSAEAFDRVAANLPERQARVWAEIVLAGARGITCDELAARWDCPQHTLSARFTELSAAGLIASSGRRPTRSGCTAQVWRAVDMQTRLPL